MEIKNTLRVPVDLEVAWKVDKKLGQPYHEGLKNVYRNKAFDISPGGMGIISKHFLPTGLRIEIAFSGTILGLKKIIRRKGEVRYCSRIKQANYRCGIKFIDLLSSYSSKFNEFKLAYEKRKEPRITLSE